MRASNTRLSRKSPPRPSANRTWLGTVLPASTYIVGCTYGTMLTVERRAAAVGKPQQHADLGAHERAIRGVERRRARRLGGRPGGARGETDNHKQRKVTPHARLLSDQKRTPPVRMKVLPPPTSPRPSTNGMSVLRFTLNVVPP